jgi:hypothetical protein
MTEHGPLTRDAAMDKSKIENLDPKEYTHLPHEEQHFEDHEQTDVAIRPLIGTLIAIGVVIAVSMVGMWGFFVVLKNWSDKGADNRRMSNVEPSIRQVPEGFPELQGVPAEGANPNLAAVDMAQMREQNKLILAGKAPMREGLKPGMAIEKAIDDALAKKIFKTGTAGAGSATPTTQQASR